MRVTTQFAKGARVRIKHLNYLKPCLQGKTGTLDEITPTPTGNLYHVQIDEPDPLSGATVEASELELIATNNSEEPRTMITTQLRKDFQRFLHNGPIIATGNQAAFALRAAKTLRGWRELESAGKVRLIQEPEQENYFDVYGEPDTEQEKEAIVEALDRNGCYWIATEYQQTCSCGETEQWEQADSVGMCVYDDPTDPFENCYVIQLMESAIEKVRATPNN